MLETNALFMQSTNENKITNSYPRIIYYKIYNDDFNMQHIYKLQGLYRGHTND